MERKEEVGRVLHEIVVERMREIFGRLDIINGYFVVLEEKVEDLRTYMKCSFEDLPADVKEKDLKDAEKIINSL